jgi:hypothetical protein
MVDELVVVNTNTSDDKALRPVMMAQIRQHLRHLHLHDVLLGADLGQPNCVVSERSLKQTL